jgi:hypothetical protein
MVSRKMLIALMTLVVFSLMVGIAAAEMVIEDEAELVLAERLREEGFDPAREDVAEAANAVLTQLREEHQDTESLIAALRQDPYVIARISDLAADLVDPTDNDDDTEAPVDDQDPSETDSEEPVDEEDGSGNWAPRERAIQRLQEHLERGLPVENALAAVTKEKHRLRWAEQEGQEADDLDEELDDADEIDDTDEIEENDRDFEEVPEEPDGNTDPADDTKQSKLERTEKKSKAKMEKELAKRERKLEKEKAKQEKREKKEERKKGRNQGKSNK